jgi:hypothetical protein
VRRRLLRGSRDLPQRGELQGRGGPSGSATSKEPWSRSSAPRRSLRATSP